LSPKDITWKMMVPAKSLPTSELLKIGQHILLHCHHEHTCQNWILTDHDVDIIYWHQEHSHQWVSTEIVITSSGWFLIPIWFQRKENKNQSRCLW
jgi:hypothetical protein